MQPCFLSGKLECSLKKNRKIGKAIQGITDQYGKSYEWKRRRNYKSKERPTKWEWPEKKHKNLNTHWPIKLKHWMYTLGVNIQKMINLACLRKICSENLVNHLKMWDSHVCQHWL